MKTLEKIITATGVGILSGIGVHYFNQDAYATAPTEIPTMIKYGIDSMYAGGFGLVSYILMDLENEI